MDYCKDTSAYKRIFVLQAEIVEENTKDLLLTNNPNGYSNISDLLIREFSNLANIVVSSYGSNHCNQESSDTSLIIEETRNTEDKKIIGVKTIFTISSFYSNELYGFENNLNKHKYTWEQSCAWLKGDVQLIPDGEPKEVINKNKHEYVPSDKKEIVFIDGAAFLLYFCCKCGDAAISKLKVI